MTQQESNVQQFTPAHRHDLAQAIADELHRLADYPNVLTHEGIVAAVSRSLANDPDYRRLRRLDWMVAMWAMASDLRPRVSEGGATQEQWNLFAATLTLVDDEAKELPNLIRDTFGWPRAREILASAGFDPADFLPAEGERDEAAPAAAETPAPAAA